MDMPPSNMYYTVWKLKTFTLTIFINKCSNFCIVFHTVCTLFFTYFKFPDIIVMNAVRKLKKVLRTMRNFEVNSGFIGGTLFQINSV